MGATQSTPARSATVNEVQAYSQSSVNGLLAVRASLANLASKTDPVDGILDDKDRINYTALKTQKNIFVGEIQTFAEETATCLRLVQDRIKNVKYASLNDCYKGFDREGTVAKIEKLQQNCIALQTEYESFRKAFEKKYGTKSAKAKRVAAAIGLTVLCIGCIVAVVLHAIPVVGWVAGPTLLTVLGVVGTGSAVFAGYLYMSKSEVEKAQDFLKNIEARLNSLKNHMSTVRANSKALSIADREECPQFLGNIVEQCDIIVRACRELR